MQQLLAMKERGDITMSQFLSLASEVSTDGVCDSAREPSGSTRDSSSCSVADSAEGGRSSGPTPSAASVSRVSDEPEDPEDDGSDAGSGNEDAPDEDDEEEEPAAKVPKIDGIDMRTWCAAHQPAGAKIARPRKLALGKEKKFSEVRNKDGRGPSTKKNGGRRNDVSTVRMPERLKDFPGHSLSIEGGQLWCRACASDIGSSRQAVADHCKRSKHLQNLKNLDLSKANKEAIQSALHDFKAELKELHGEAVTAQGLANVTEDTQVARGEVLEEFLKAGVEPRKLDSLRPFLERSTGVSLTGRSHMMQTYVPPLKLKELKTLKAEFAGELVGVYHDGTTHCGESFAIVYRACKPGFVFRVCCVRVAWLRGSMTADHISSVLMDTIIGQMGVCAPWLMQALPSVALGCASHCHSHCACVNFFFVHRQRRRMWWHG